MIVCKKCKMESPEGSKFCVKCGGSLTKLVKEIEEEKNPSVTGFIKSGMDTTGELVKDIIGVPFELFGIKPKEKKRKN